MNKQSKARLNLRRFRFLCLCAVVLCCGFCFGSFINLAEKLKVYPEQREAWKQNDPRSRNSDLIEPKDSIPPDVLENQTKKWQERKPEYPFLETYFFCFTLTLPFLSLFYTLLNWQKGVQGTETLADQSNGSKADPDPLE